jgi:hypothetical protein
MRGKPCVENHAVWSTEEAIIMVDGHSASHENNIYFIISRKLAIHRATKSNFAFPHHLNFALSALLLRQAGSGENSGFMRELR